MATKSVQRTLKYLRDRGHTAAVVERYNQYTRHREDLFGFIDILSLDPRGRIVGVQACGTDWGQHLNKLSGERADIVGKWIGASGLVWLIGWRKLKAIKANGKKGKQERWVPRLGTVGVDSDGLVVTEASYGYLCGPCALSRGGVWPSGHLATYHVAVCSDCLGWGSLASADDWDWPIGSNYPGYGAGRD